MSKVILPPPPRDLITQGQIDWRSFYRWLVQLRDLLQNDTQFDWSQIDFTGSDIADIASRLHSDLQSILEVDDTDTDTDKDKHVSNALAKSWTDGVSDLATHEADTSPHGATGDIVGEGDIATTAVYGVLKQAVAVGDAAAPTAYLAHSSGGITVTSTAATDLDTTAAALETLRNETAALTTKVNDLLATLRTSDALDT